MLGKSLKLGAIGVGGGLACWSASAYNKKSLGARSASVLAFGGASSATGVRKVPNPGLCNSLMDTHLF